MSSEILESLSNKELREKCVEHGLPNVPITDTSRKLLIRRLQKAIDGDDKSTEKPKGRRETIHVTKITKTEEISTNSPKKTKPINNRRTTNEVTTTTTEPDSVVREIPIQVQSVTQRRRSGRTTPISQLERVATTSFKRKSEAIEEDSENDIVILDETRPSEIVLPRQSRSPSLSKSITVTTSYVKAPVTIEEDLEDIADDDDDENGSDVEVINENVEQHFKPLTRPAISPYRISTYEISRDSQKTRPTFTEIRPLLSSTPSSNFSKHFESSSTTRRYTTSGYKPLVDNSATTYLQHNSINNGRNDDDDDDNDEEIEAPYLSDFARRLSRLKAEPIVKHGGQHHEDSIQNRELPRRYYSTQIGGRRSYSQKDSIADSFRQFCV